MHEFIKIIQVYGVAELGGGRGEGVGCAFYSK
jgi:hypothetical protein